ncbi:MAG: FAD-dependent oxidoreductase, partial [Phycisphaerales bacterium]
AEAHDARRTGLELLLSDHVGDCTAPCQNTCPAQMDVPSMLRGVAAGDMAGAIQTIKREMAFPGVLGWVCPELCEHTCRRSDLDKPVSICLVKRYAAEVDLASDVPHLPLCKPASGKKTAIVGAGPAGLSAAYHLLQLGHACDVFDKHAEPGGMLRSEYDEASLPRSVLDAEIGVIVKLGARLRMETRIGKDMSLAELTEAYDAVLLAVGKLEDTKCFFEEVEVQSGKLRINPSTYQTSRSGVFAAGDAVQPGKVVVRALASGKNAARCIDQYVSGMEVGAPSRPFTSRAGRLNEDELVQLTVGCSYADRATPSGAPGSGMSEQQARQEALRCLHCDCARKENCKLRDYAEAYGAVVNRYRGERRTYERHLQHADIVYEPGKCIVCGLCVKIAAEQGESLGLTFIGRGFDVRVDVPFSESIAEGLKRAARKCAEACPTGALALRAAAECGVGMNSENAGCSADNTPRSDC